MPHNLLVARAKIGLINHGVLHRAGGTQLPSDLFGWENKLNNDTFVVIFGKDVLFLVTANIDTWQLWPQIRFLIYEAMRIGQM